MRRGLKRAATVQFNCGVSSFKPIPDEEGTETAQLDPTQAATNWASNRSPMRRGLKPAAAATRTATRTAGFKPIPDEEGTETKSRSGSSVAVVQLQTDPR